MTALLLLLFHDTVATCPFLANLKKMKDSPLVAVLSFTGRSKVSRCVCPNQHQLVNGSSSLSNLRIGGSLSGGRQRRFGFYSALGLPQLGERETRRSVDHRLLGFSSSEFAEGSWKEQLWRTKTLTQQSSLYPGVPLTTGAIQNLLSKLPSDDYNMVREALGSISDGVYASYETTPAQSSGRDGVDALLQAAMTVQDLVDGG